MFVPCFAQIWQLYPEVASIIEDAKQRRELEIQAAAGTSPQMTNSRCQGGSKGWRRASMDRLVRRASTRLTRERSSTAALPTRPRKESRSPGGRSSLFVRFQRSSVSMVSLGR